MIVAPDPLTFPDRNTHRIVPPQPWELEGADVGGLVRPILEAIARLSGMESTYLIVFDWERREQEVRYAFNSGDTSVEEGHRIPLPAGISREMFPGVTRSPQTVGYEQPDSMVARRLGLKTFLSVPVTIAKHRLFGMLCGASREAHELSEPVVGLFESFAGIMGEHLVQVESRAIKDRAAAAESELLARARFIAEAEHRLKTTLTALRGAAMVLHERRSELSEQTRIELQASVARNALLLSHDLEGLLGSARADVRTSELSMAVTDLEPVAREVAMAFDGLDAEHQVVTDIEGPIRAFVDARTLFEVLGHLVDNAIKYSPGGGRVTIRATETDGAVAVEVIDQGIGLPEGVDVFAAFHRGDPHDQRTPGVGLGLHIVRNLVGAMGGTVTARNGPDEGSTFTVNLPATPEAS